MDDADDEPAEIRRSLVRDALDDTPAAQRRREWDAHASRTPVSEGWRSPGRRSAASRACGCAPVLWSTGGRDLASPGLSPLLGDVSGLPPLLIQAGDHEVLLSDATGLHEKVLEAGGCSTLRVWPRMWHVRHSFAGLAETREALDDVAGFLDEHLASAHGRRATDVAGVGASAGHSGDGPGDAEVQ